jgi:hypothetical protein
VENRCCRFDRGVDTVCQGSFGLQVDNAANAGQGYQHLSILTGGLRYPSCYHDNFDAIFNAIAGDVIVRASASCDLVLADRADFDPALASVVYSSVSSGSQVNTELRRVANATACTPDGWYHDDSSGTSTIRLCPSLCGVVKADQSARVWAELACASDAAPTSASFVYGGLCDAGQGMVWLDLGYEGTVVDDGTIVLRARVARDDASLASASWVDLRAVTSSNPSCPLGSGCEVDVFSTLGAFDARLPTLELEVTLNPSSSGRPVSLESWDLTYTCTDNQ